MNGLDHGGDREIRIFLSSTFSDMQEERNYLTKKIFPRIREICEKRGVRFSVLDLRWGITEEESRTGKVIEICMDEIKRTKPFFLGLLGGRYGWIPTEEETKLNWHLAEKYPWIQEYMKEGCSITEIEMQYAVLKEAEKIDAFFFLRNMESVPAKFREKDGSPEKTKLERLRNEVLAQSKDGRCTADFYSDMSGLGRMVQERLLAMIDRRFPADEKPDSLGAILQRQAFERAKLRFNYVDNGWKRSFGLEQAFKSASVIFVSGEKGIGKSALLANWHPDDEAVDGTGTRWRIIRTDIDDTVKDLLRLSEIFKDQLKQIDPSLPELDGETETSVPDYAGKCSENIVWVIDGLEKVVTESVGNFGFLFSLPDNVKAVIAGTADFINRISGYAKGGSRTVRVYPLEENEIIRILKERLSEHGKSLTERQEVHIMSSSILSNPSLLQLFIAELVQFGIHEQLDGFIDRLVNVSDREEFVSRVLDIIEEDFGSGMTGKVLGLIACNKYGIDESLLTEELKFTPLEWSAIYGAIEPLVLRHDGIISMKEDYMLRCISGRYVPDNEQGKKLREMAIRILKKEKKRQLHKFSVFDRLSHAIYGLNLGGDDALRLDAVSYGLARQYLAIGKKRQAIRIVSHDAMSMMNSLGLAGYALFFEALAAGMSPERFFSFPKLLMYSVFDNDGGIIFSYASIFSQTDPGIPHRILKKVKRMPLPKRYKENACRLLNNLKPQAEAGNMEDSWKPGKEIYDVAGLYAFACNIPSIPSMSRVRHIREQAEAMAASLPEDSMTGAYMKYIISFALVREGKPDEAEKVLLSTTGMTDPDNNKNLKFEIAFAREDYDGCRKALEDLKQMTAAIHDGRHISGRHVTELWCELAIEEKTAYRAADLADGMAKRLKGLYDELIQAGGDGRGYMRTIAYALDVKKCFKAAAEAYKILLEAETDAADAAVDHANLAICLDEDKRYPEAADAYMSAAGFYVGKDIIRYLDKIYSAAEDYIAAKKGAEAAAAVEDAFMEVRKAGTALSPETRADCYNRIIVMLCNKVYDHFDSAERPLEIGYISMKTILECTAEPDIKVLSNFTYLLDRVSNLCPSPEKFREAFSLLRPHIDMLLRERKEQFIGILPTLAIIAGDRDTAGRLLDMVEEKKDKYAEQAIMLSMTSEDEEVRKNATSSVIKTIGLNTASPEDIRKDFVNLLRKYNCLGPFMEQCRGTADTDSLFTLWNIAAATSDEAGMSWCEDRLKAIVAESRSADILATFIAQRRKFSYKIEAKEISSLFRDWLGDACSELQNVVAFIDTVLRDCQGGSRNSLYSQGHYNSRRNEISAYVISALEHVGNKTAYMEKIVDAVKEIQFSKDRLVENMITISDALCSIYANGNIPALKGRLAELLRLVTDVTVRTESGNSESPYLEHDSNKPINYHLADIYDLYALLGEPAPDNVVKAKLKCTAGKPARMDNSFPEILAREIERGYIPDTEAYALATGYYISRNMTEEAEGCLELFAGNAGDDGKFALAIKLCRAVIDAGKGEYGAASAEFSDALAFNFGTGETAEDYRSFRNLFSDFPELTDINSLRQLASISSIYAGYYSEGIERAGMISIEGWYDKTKYMYTEGLLVSLAMIRSGQYEDALKYFQDKFSFSLEEFELLPEYEHLTLHLVKIETAKMYVAKEDMEKASRMLLHAGLMVTLSTHPICRRELARAEAMFREFKEGQEPKRAAEGQP